MRSFCSALNIGSHPHLRDLTTVYEIRGRPKAATAMRAQCKTAGTRPAVIGDKLRRV